MAYSRGFLAYMHALINGENEMRFILLLLTVFAVSTVNAQEKIDTDVSTYTNLLKQLDQHPALEAVRQQVIEQREAANGAGGLPDPMVMFGINNYPADGSGGFDRFAMTSKSIGFIQKIPNAGVRASSVLAKEILSNKARIAVDFTHQRLIAALNTTLAEQSRVRQEKNLIKEDIKLLKQESAYWDGRLQAGDSALDERSRVEAELAQSEAKIATLYAEEIQFREELKRLTQTTEIVPVPSIFPLPWPNTSHIFPVLLAEKDVQVARANVESAESAFGPNYQFGVTYAQRDNTGSFDGGDFASVQFGVSIPLWASKNQKPKLRSAQAGVSRVQAILADTKSQWHQQLATQFAKIKETQATKHALEEKKKAIQTQITSLRNAYETDGRLDILVAAKRSMLGLAVQLVQLDARYIKQVSGYNAMFQHMQVTDGQNLAPLKTVKSKNDSHPLEAELQEKGNL